MAAIEVGTAGVLDAGAAEVDEADEEVAVNAGFPSAADTPLIVV